MQSLLSVDRIDHAILAYLQEHAKHTNAQLAQHIGLSPASTLERVKKLERQGIIKSYRAIIDPHKLDLPTCVFLQIKLQSLTNVHVTAFQTGVARIPAVVACYQVVGDADFFIKVITKDIATYQHLVTYQLSTITSIQSIKAFVTTTTIKDTGVPIPSKTGNASTPNARTHDIQHFL